MAQGVSIIEESLPDGFNAGNGTVGTSPQPLAASYPVRKKVTVKAHADNGNVIKVGPVGNVNFVLAAGQSVDLHVDDVAKVTIVGGGAVNTIPG